MNNLITTAKTMSSREIAELTGKRHDNVIRKIVELKNLGLISNPQSEDGIKAAIR